MHNDLSLFCVFWAEKDKAMLQVYEPCSYDVGDTLMIHGRKCRVDKCRRVSYQEHTIMLHVTLLEYVNKEPT